MAKFKDLSLDLETGEHIDFDDDDLIKMGYDGAELYLNSTLSGVRAAQPYHMVRYDQLTEASGTLKNYIDEGLEAQDEFIELEDTPNTYSGSEDKYLRVTTTGVIFDTVDHGELDGLSDDDHLQYVPRDGSRGFTSTVSGVYPTESYHLTTKQYLDDEIATLSGILTEADNYVKLIDYSEDDTTTTTTSTTYQNKITVTLPAGMDATIRIMWSIEYNASANNKDVWVRAYNITDGVVLGENNQQTNNNLNWWTFAGFGYIEFTGTSKTIALQYHAGTADCSVRNAHLEACRVSFE